MTGAALAVLVKTLSPSEFGGERRACLGIDVQAFTLAPGNELIRLYYDPDQPETHALETALLTLGLFLPCVEISGEHMRIRHDFEDARIVVSLEPADAGDLFSHRQSFPSVGVAAPMVSESPVDGPTAAGDSHNISDQIQDSARRSGSSPAGTLCKGALEAEEQLLRVNRGFAADMGGHVLPLSEASAHVRSNVHELPSCHVCHGALLGQTGESPSLQPAEAGRAVRESGGESGDQGRPVRAQLRSSCDSRGVGKADGGLPCVLRGGRAE